MILTLLYIFSGNVFQVLKEVIPKNKNVFVIYQNAEMDGLSKLNSSLYFINCVI